MDDSAHTIAQQEIDALEEFIDDRRDTHQRSQADTDNQAVYITKLEGELSDLQAEEEGYREGHVVDTGPQQDNP